MSSRQKIFKNSMDLMYRRVQTIFLRGGELLMAWQWEAIEIISAKFANQRHRWLWQKWLPSLIL